MTGPPSTTRRALWWRLASLLVVTAIVGGTSFEAFRGVHTTAGWVRDRAVPMAIEVSAARAALVDADRAAMRSFSLGVTMLSGPGHEFENQMSLASQNLAQAAEHNMAGTEGREKLRLVEGMLSSYSSLVGRADVHYRPGGQPLLGAAELWDASRLLHGSVAVPAEGKDGRDGILDKLDELLTVQQRALADEVTGADRKVTTFLLWCAPLLVLLLLLGWTQVFFSRRFRRMASPPLLFATALALALASVMSVTTVGSFREMDDTHRHLRSSVRFWTSQMAIVDRQGQGMLKELFPGCEAGASECGPTVTLFTRGSEPDEPRADLQQVRSTQQLRAESRALGADGQWMVLIVLVSVLIGSLVGIGFRPRLDEYRFRP